MVPDTHHDAVQFWPSVFSRGVDYPDKVSTLDTENVVSSDIGLHGIGVGRKEGKLRGTCRHLGLVRGTYIVLEGASKGQEQTI